MEWYIVNIIYAMRKLLRVKLLKAQKSKTT